MENSTNEENIKQQHAGDTQHKIETVTPDTENVQPLSRQESPEELKAANAISDHPKPKGDNTAQPHEAEKKETEQENSTNPQDPEQESLPVQDNTDNAESEEKEENINTSAEQTDESPQSENNTTSENKSDDPRDGIETVSP